MTMRHVTIFGASSRQGQEQVGAALTEEHAVRAITRNAEIFADRTDARLEIVAADFEDPASLAAACRDADVIFFQPPQFGSREAIFRQVGNVAAAARQTSVPLAIYNSTMRSEEHTSELQSLMRNSYAVFSLYKQSEHPLQSHSSVRRTE